jgi:hypothetical protein
MISSLRSRAVLSTLSLLALAGCSGEPPALSAPTPVAAHPAKSLADPLTEQEARRFLEILDSLPDGKVPAFEPLAQATALKSMSGAQLVRIYRQEYRAMFDAARHAQRWREDPELMAVLAEHQTTPEDFASLMIRMSCAITAGTLSADVDLPLVQQKAEQQVKDLIAQVDRLQSGSRTPATIDARLQSLDALQEIVAFAEFARLLLEVPHENFAVVQRHRSRLIKYLPQAGSIENFERTIESSVVPTSFERQAPAE